MDNILQTLDGKETPQLNLIIQVHFTIIELVEETSPFGGWGVGWHPLQYQFWNTMCGPWYRWQSGQWNFPRDHWSVSGSILPPILDPYTHYQHREIMLQKRQWNFWPCHAVESPRTMSPDSTAVLMSGRLIQLQCIRGVYMLVSNKWDD